MNVELTDREGEMLIKMLEQRSRNSHNSYTERLYDGITHKLYDAKREASNATVSS